MSDAARRGPREFPAIARPPSPRDLRAFGRSARVISYSVALHHARRRSEIESCSCDQITNVLVVEIVNRRVGLKTRSWAPAPARFVSIVYFRPEYWAAGHFNSHGRSEGCGGNLRQGEKHLTFSSRGRARGARHSCPQSISCVRQPSQSNIGQKLPANRLVVLELSSDGQTKAIRREGDFVLHEVVKKPASQSRIGHM